MTSLVWMSTWIYLIPILTAEQGFKCPMWQWTIAWQRNRPLLESWPVLLHLAQIKSVSVLMKTLPCSESWPAGKLAWLAMSATDVSKGVQTDHVIAYHATNFVCPGKLGWCKTWAELKTQTGFFQRLKLVHSWVDKPQSPWLKIMWVPCLVVVQSV